MAIIILLLVRQNVLSMQMHAPALKLMRRWSTPLPALCVDGDCGFNDEDRWCDGNVITTHN